MTMTNSTNERQQRLREIRDWRQRLTTITIGEKHWIDTIDFLLSLLDSEAAGKRDFEWALRELADGWIANNEREGPYGFNQNARRVLEFIASDTATSMRDLCVEKVKELLPAYQAASYAPPTNALREAITALQSLTLDNQQPVKEESCCISALIESRERAAKRKT